MTTSLLDTSKGTYIREDWAKANDVNTDNNVGNSGFQLTAITGNSAALSIPTAQGRPFIRSTTTADSGSGIALHSLPDHLVLNGGGLGWMRGAFRYPDITGNVLTANQFRIGLDDSVTATDPTVGIWLRSTAGVLSLNAHSADHGDRTVNVANVPTLTSGTTAVLGATHTFELRWGGVNAEGGPSKVDLWIDGYLAASTRCLIDNDEEVEFKIAHWCSGTNTLELDVFGIEAWVPFNT